MKFLRFTQTNNVVVFVLLDSNEKCIDGKTKFTPNVQLLKNKFILEQNWAFLLNL